MTTHNGIHPGSGSSTAALDVIIGRKRVVHLHAFRAIGPCIWRRFGTLFHLIHKPPGGSRFRVRPTDYLHGVYQYLQRLS